MNKTYMLDTNICSFIMREQPEAVIRRLEQAVMRNHRIVVSAITYAEMCFGTIGKRPHRATPGWLKRSVAVLMRCWLGIGLRLMRQQTLRLRLLRLAHLLAPMIPPSLGMPLRPVRFW